MTSPALASFIAADATARSIYATTTTCCATARAVGGCKPVNAYRERRGAIWQEASPGQWMTRRSGALL